MIYGKLKNLLSYDDDDVVCIIYNIIIIIINYYYFSVIDNNESNHLNLINFELTIIGLYNNLNINFDWKEF